MDVELVRWPGDEVRLDEARRVGAARLILVPQGVVPPMPDDVLEDWVRLPASDDDIRLRVKVLSERARSTFSDEPHIDESGLLRFGGRYSLEIYAVTLFAMQFLAYALGEAS